MAVLARLWVHGVGRVSCRTIGAPALEEEWGRVTMGLGHSPVSAPTPRSSALALNSVLLQTASLFSRGSIPVFPGSMEGLREARMKIEPRTQLVPRVWVAGVTGMVQGLMEG